MIILIIAVKVLLFMHASSRAEDTVHASATAVREERARLPCDVSSDLPEDRVVLILWYRGAAGTPIYSFDARGENTDDPKHWSDEVLLDQRAYFQLMPGSPWSGSSVHGAHLELYPVQARDQATYRCRVDYLLSPTKNTIVNFTVIIPPNKPEIYNSSEHLVSGRTGVSIIGPYNEGSELILDCKVSGGRPPPLVSWLVNDQMRPTETLPEAGGVYKSNLVIAELSRYHLHANLECRASNFNNSTPVSSTVTLDMNFRPQNVTILSTSESLSAGTEYELVCQAWGSRPAAVISWWKGGTLALKDSHMTTSPNSNVTTSILKYRAEMTDSGKYLTCRAENPLILHSAREDGLKLNIFYKPVVTLQMGSNLDPTNIKEGDDVYFECHINANPVVHRVFWYHNGASVEHQVARGIIIQNQTLVLQRISRDSAGFYTCRALNMEGEGASQPVELRVKYKPYCRRHSKTIYGTALHEPASVTCEVEANPGPVTFRWTFNNTSEHLPIPASAVASQGLTSVASYAPKSHLDYGTLLCWAFNDIGEQTVPCAFAIIPAGPPDPPKNCSIANQTTDAIEVECVQGFDGGLPQVFHMEVYDSSTGSLHRNMTSTEPVFLLTSLRPGLAFLMVTYAANSKGRSEVAKLETFTLKVAEKRTGPPALFEFTPVFGILLGVMLAILLAVVVTMVVMKFRKPQPSQMGGHCPAGGDESKRDVESKPLAVGVLRPRAKEGSSLEELEESEPDLIPHKPGDMISFAHYEAIDRGGGGPGTTQFRSCHEEGLSPLQHQQPLQPNPGPVPGDEVTYAELALPMKDHSGYPMVSIRDPCIYATIDHQRPASVNFTDYPLKAIDPSMSSSSTLDPRRRRVEGVPGIGQHHMSNPNLYATLEHRRGGSTTTTSTTSHNIYATLPHRRESACSASYTSVTSPTGFRDFRRSLRTPLVRRPSESVV